MKDAKSLQDRLQSLYGVAPESCKDDIRRVCARLEEEPKMKRITTVALALALALLLAGAALAVASRAGLLDFDTGEQSANPQTFAYQLGGEGALLSETIGDLEITVTQGAGQLNHYALVTTVALKPGADGLLDACAPSQPPAADAPPVYAVQASILHENVLPDSEDLRINADGSLSFLSQLQLEESADTAQMYCMVRYVRAEPGQAVEDLVTHTQFLPFTIPVEDTLGARILAAPVSIPDAAITLDALYLKQTAGGVGAFVYFQYDGGPQTDYTAPDALYLALGDAAGNSLLAPDHRYIGAWVDANRYRAYIPLPLPQLPESATLLVYDANENLLASAGLPLARASTLPEAPAGYALPLIGDYRDFPLPGRNRLPEHVYLSSQDQVPIVAYRAPGQEDAVLLEMYSGVQSQVLAEYGDWALLNFGSLYAGACGYVQKSQLAESAQAATPGVLTGTVTDACQACISPQKPSTALAALHAGESVLVLGQRDGWYYVAAVTPQGIKPVGYVEKQHLSLSEDKTLVALDQLAEAY